MFLVNHDRGLHFKINVINLRLHHSDPEALIPGTKPQQQIDNKVGLVGNIGIEMRQKHHLIEPD